MKRLILLAPACLMASPAFAHGGAHLHPHGIETAIAALSFATVGVLYLAYRK